ncbi:MAG: hypothetical protein QW059_03445 [Nitrososphaerota archaeon]
MRRNNRVVSLVGYHCIVTRKSDGVKLSDLIVGETENTVLIRTTGGLKRLPKKGHIFEILSDGVKMVADGDELVGSPSQTLKRVRHNWQKRLRQGRLS